MSRVRSAYLYYARRVIANRLRAIGRKMKRPRYIFGMLLVIGYFGLFIFRPMTSFARSSWADAHGRDAPLLIAMGLCFAQIMLNWVFGCFTKGIPFKQSEVHILFPAPLSRRQVLAFKWWQTQFGAIVFSIIFGVAISRSGYAHPLWAMLGYWVAANALACHGGFALMSIKRWRLRGGIWNGLVKWIPAVVLTVGVAVLGSYLWPRTEAGGALGKLIELSHHPLFLPFAAPLRWLCMPIVAEGPLEFLMWLPAALAIVAVNAWLAVRVEVPFEDAAIEQADQLDAFKEQGWSALRSKKAMVRSARLFELTPHGRPWMAFVWKNALSIGRLGKRRFIALLFGVVVMLAVSFTMMVNEGEVANKMGYVIGGITFYVGLLGPSLFRVDLRIDIPHFDVIKALPIRGRALVFGEVLAPTIALTCIQTVLFTMATILVTKLGDRPIGFGEKAALLPAAVVLFAGLNLLLMTVENLIALFFPSFVRLGRGYKPGLDNFGQQLIGVLLRLIGYMGLFLVPIAVAGGTGAALGALVHPIFGLVAGAVVGSALLVGEAALLIHLSERRYDRYDLTDENLTVD